MTLAYYDAGGPVGATGLHRSLAAGAAGQVALALRANPVDRALGAGIQARCATPPPPVQWTGTDRWNQGAIQEQLIARRPSAAPGAGFLQAQAKSGYVQRIRQADIHQGYLGYLEGYPHSLSVELICGTYP